MSEGPAAPDSTSGGDADAVWQHVAALRPRLRQHVRILPQEFRAERWYLLHDESSGRFLRFDSLAHEFIGRLDGDLTVGEIVDNANAAAGEARLDAEGVLGVIARLQDGEVLSGALPLDAREALQRFDGHRRQRRQQRFGNPLAIRMPLFDPDRLLERLVPLARGLFTPGGFCVWMGTVLLALVVAIAHYAEIASAIGALQLDAADAIAFWLAFPVLKALHELGHGLAVKVWGGEVHETGIQLLVFVPVPYVDASAAWTFRDKRRRMLVSAAGIMVELLIAALGLLIWVVVEPGLVRDTALAFAILGSLSTVLFNANPLMRFDGYHVLEDLIEVPDLNRRSRRYCLYLMQRYALGLTDGTSPVTAYGERRWFVSYGVLAPLYRLTVTLGIAFYLSGKFLVIGVLLASWVLLMQLLKPLVSAARFLLFNDRLRKRRRRAVATVALAASVLLGVVLMPVPLTTRAEGVVWPANGGQILGVTEGFVAEVYVTSGDRVRAGDPLLRLVDRVLETQRRVLAARIDEARVRQSAEAEQSRVRGRMVADEVSALEAERRRLDERHAALLVRSPLDGRFVQHDPHDLSGRFVRTGDPLGYILEPEGVLVVRAVVDQQDIGLLRSDAIRAEIVLASRPDRMLATKLVREVPSGTRRLPSAALGTVGGGRIRTDPADKSGQSAAHEVFQLDLALPTASDSVGIGERAQVRFEHGSEALWRLWSRRVRQLFLGTA